jgi:hypothetical protein
MIDSMEFVAMSDDESAATIGGDSLWSAIIKAVLPAVISECVKFSADFRQGFSQGYAEAI